MTIELFVIFTTTVSFFVSLTISNVGIRSTDANRHFKPFGIALVPHDENETSY